MSRARSWLAVAAAIVVLDQLTKWLVTRSFAPGESVAVTSFFNMVLVHNPGAAFSFLSDQPGWQRGLFIAIALVASVWIVHLLRKHPAERPFALALTLVLAGAVGNVIDRILIGAVVDFLDLNIVLGQYGTGAATGALAGDLNFDGVVDFVDLNILLGRYGVVCAAPAAE